MIELYNEGVPEEKTYHDPHIALNRIYTRRGDTGLTSLVGGQRVPKDTLRIECYGTVDELNSYIGMARVSSLEHPELEPLAAILLRVQHELFNLGSILSTLPADVHPRQPRVSQAEIDRLEQEIDQANQSLPPLRSFVLPGGSRVNAELHAARTVCRRAERIAVGLSSHQGAAPEHAIAYLNRLSDALFVWSRWANTLTGAGEVLWEPKLATSGTR
jgi:cob(I)alamin adenosyltransferase